MIWSLFQLSFQTCINIGQGIWDFLKTLPNLIWSFFEFSFETSISVGQGIWDFLKTLPSLIWSFFEFSFETSISVGQGIWDFLKTLPSLIWGLFQFSIDTMIATVQGFWDFVTTLPTLILEGIKSIFIPDTDVINEKIESLKNVFTSTFGIEAYDMSEVLGTETQLTNQEGTVKIGSYEFTGTFLDVSFIVKAVTTFRPFIRGFLVLLLLFYNINQFLSFINQHPVAIGVHVKNDPGLALPASISDRPRLKG